MFLKIYWKYLGFRNSQLPGHYFYYLKPEMVVVQINEETTFFLNDQKSDLKLVERSKFFFERLKKVGRSQR